MSLPKGLSDARLLLHLRALLRRGRSVEAEVIAHLGEIDARRLYLAQACPSMFHYCVQVLHFAEGVAYKRIAVARATRRFPGLLEALADGDLHLSAASLIAPHLSAGNVVEYLALARHATSREIRQRIADRMPKPALPASIRRVPGTRRYCIRFVVDHEVHEQLQELRALLRDSIPNGDVAKILARAVGALHAQIHERKLGGGGARRGSRSPAASARRAVPPETTRSSKHGEAAAEFAKPATGTKSAREAAQPGRATPSRHIPAAIRRAVWERDGGRCTFESRGGRRCGSREFLEFHHQRPWARCREHTLDNIALHCRAHNQHEANLAFGAAQMARVRERAPTRGKRSGSGSSGAEIPTGFKSSSV